MVSWLSCSNLTFLLESKAHKFYFQDSQEKQAWWVEDRAPNYSWRFPGLAFMWYGSNIREAYKSKGFLPTGPL